MVTAVDFHSDHQELERGPRSAPLTAVAHYPPNLVRYVQRTYHEESFFVRYQKRYIRGRAMSMSSLIAYVLQTKRVGVDDWYLEQIHRRNTI